MLAALAYVMLAVISSPGLGQSASQVVVPFVGQQAQNHYADYLERRLPKAFAISSSGAWGGRVARRRKTRGRAPSKIARRIPC